MRYKENTIMAIGDMVRIKETSNSKRQGKVCFVEDLLGHRFAMNRDQEQISLYAIDGEYVGDWFEDEFENLHKKITEKELLELIEKNKEHRGLVADFTRILNIIKGVVIPS